MRRGLILAGALALAPSFAVAAPRATDPDWPCQQVLVPVLTAEMMWGGPPLDSVGDWHGEPQVVALVERIAPREVSIEDGEAAVAEFLRDHAADHAKLAGLIFVGLLDETNRERRAVIGRIKDLAERQRNLAALIARLTSDLDAMPAEPAGEQAAERADLQQRLTFTSRTYAQVQSTMRYACQVPATFDRRLGAYAHMLADAAR